MIVSNDKSRSQMPYKMEDWRKNGIVKGLEGDNDKLVKTPKKKMWAHRRFVIIHYTGHIVNIKLLHRLEKIKNSTLYWKV